MRGGFQLLVALAATFLVACTSTLASNTTSPTPTPTPTPSPSPSPVPSPSPSAQPTPSSSGAAPTITALPFHNGEVGVIYLSETLVAAGGSAPYSWSISGGTFPPGLTLSSDGVVTGNNTAAGDFAFTVRVTDSANATADSPVKIHVYPVLTVTQPCASSCGVEQGCTICGLFGRVSGGLPPYHFTVVADNRPTGMGVNGLNLTGTFPGPGKYSLKVQVQDDQFGATRTVTANWSVFAHIAITPTTAFTCGFSGDSCSLGVQYTGGTPGGAPTVMIVSVGPAMFGGQSQGPPSMTLPGTSACNPPGSQVTPTGLPIGTTITYAAGTVTINMAGQFGGNANMCSYQARVTIALVDQSPCGPGNCTSNVATIDIGI